MRIIINGKQVTLPTSPREITLGQRIDFHNQYGREFDLMVSSIQAMPDGIEKDLEIVHFQMEKMFAAFAFFTGTNPEALKESEFIDQIANLYYSSLSVLLEEENTPDLQNEFYWKDCMWQLHPAELKHGSMMTFGEFIDSKQMVKDMADLGKGNWEAMLRLAAIFLRKKGEVYDKSFSYEGSDRIELMRELPMDIAIQVGFFLTGSLRSFLNTFQSFSQAKDQKQGGSARNTSSGSAGLNSIDCARIAPLFDVLIYESEEKELGEAQVLDQEVEMKKQRSQQKLR
jgi:hypothetical protein